MKKLIVTFVAFYYFITITAQENQEISEIQEVVQQRTVSNSSSSNSENSGGVSDFVLPKSSPFQLGKSLEGAIQNSINKATGKVVFSIPIASISANTVGYSTALTYNGATTLATAKNTNEFNPTSVTGVGFSLGIPKIIADYKNTAARDDDTFYLADGNHTKLICTKRTDTYLEFQTEKYTLWKIKYIIKRSTGFTQFPSGQWVETFKNSDSWEVIKEDGTIYKFGEEGYYSSGNNAKFYMSTWGNWIGDSNQTPTSVLTTAWNLYQITDQWSNSITFSYEKVQGKQNTSQSGRQHTEAIYLKEIKSSNNSKITFTYENKIPQEYYEPHIEQAEPDAYQEQYEKKYLQQVQTYNTHNELIFTYKLEYDLVNHRDPTKPSQGKRYLKRFVQKNKNEEALPAQEFTYYTSGDFKGRIHKITYPTGGEVTYNYTKKTLFYNGSNRFTGSQPNLSGYYLTASYNAGDYVLKLYRTKNPIYDDLYRYKIVRYHWTGSHWTINEFTVPNYLPWKKCISYGNGCKTVYLDGFKIVYGTNYYALMHFSRSGNWARLNLFHLKSDGKTWHSTNDVISSVESKNEAPYTEDPVLLNGNDFVVIGTKRTGELRIYNWNGNGWNYKYIDQRAGEYYYAARNNFILSLNEDGSNDLSNNVFYEDNYYIHYLDSEKKWHTKSWTNKALQSINTIQAASYFYPSNAMTAFMADNNPEYFLRWDTNYNLISVDDELESYNDNIPVRNPSTGFFTVGGLRSYSISRTSYLYKIARFRGNGWETHLNYDYGNSISPIAYGKDLVLYADSKRISYSLYNPNTSSWKSEYLLTANSFTTNMETSLFGNFLLLNETIYEKSRNPFSLVGGVFNWLEQTPKVAFTTTNGLNYAYTSSLRNIYGEAPVKTRLYYPNKTNRRVSSINFDGKFGIGGIGKFGGYEKFLAGNSIYLRNIGSFNDNTNQFYTYLYRIIDDKVNENIEDIVVDFIEIDNQQDPVRKVQYEFDQYAFLPNESAYYGKSTTQHKGNGNSNNGKVVTFSNTGITDMRLLGTPIKTEVRDANGTLKSETTYTNQLFDKTYYNSSSTPVGKGYYVRTTQKTENSIQDNGTLTISEKYEYNDIGLLGRKTVLYESGKKIVTNTTYANTLYSFLNAKNILNKPAKIVQEKNNVVIGTSEVIWKEENWKVFPYKTLAGVTSTKVLTEITKVNNLGLTQEESNGKGIYNVNLLGYNHTYPVASISNARYSEVIAALEVSYETLQTLDTEALKRELLNLYTALPKASITISLYDNNGNVSSKIDARKEEVHYFYDTFHRLIYVQDAQGNRLTQTEYHFKQ